MARNRIDISRRRFAWESIETAVLAVYFENERRDEEGTSPVTAKSDAWCIFSELRQDLFRRVRDHWCKLTGMSRFEFLFSEDGAVLLYFKVRKRKPDEQEQMSAEAGGKARGLFLEESRHE